MVLNMGAKVNDMTPKPPMVSVVEVTDPTAAGESIQVLDQDVLQLEPQPFVARRVLIRLAHSILIYHRVEHRARSLTQLDPSYCCFAQVGEEQASYPGTPRKARPKT